MRQSGRCLANPLNADHNLIVTCPYVQTIKEFSPRGDLQFYCVTSLFQVTSSTRGTQYN